MRKSLVLVMLVATFVTGFVLADEGRTIIRGPAPITLSKPGHYVVGEDIQTPPSGYTILIDSSEVTLDLNGFTLHNNNARVIQISGGATDVTIRNGRLRQTSGNSGIYYSANQPKIRLRVERVEIWFGDGVGIGVDSPGTVDISDCTIHPSGDGIGMRIRTSGTGKFRGRIRNNFVNGSGDESGILIWGLDSGEVSHNTVYSSSEGGITVGGSGGSNLIEGNVVRGSESGLNIGTDHSLIRNNTVKTTNATGMSVGGAGNRVVGNVVYAGETGISVGGSFNLLASNQVDVADEDYCAVRFENSNQHVYRDNVLRGGIKAFAVCGAANTDAGGNTLFGGTEDVSDDDRELEPCTCCDAGGAGCDCGECEEAVCDFDGYCCDNWDSSCAILALSLCNCCPGQTPGECGTDEGK